MAEGHNNSRELSW